MPAFTHERRNPDNLKQIIRDVINETVPVAVNASFERLGFDVSDPIEMQRQAAYLREATKREQDPEVWADRQHLRDWRKQCEAVKSAATSVAVKTVVAGIFVLIMLGGVAWLRGQGL